MQAVQDSTEADVATDSSPSVNHTSRMTLEVGDRRLAVTHLCGDWMILREPTDLPAGIGTLHLLLGRQYRRREVRFPSGIKSSRRRQPVELGENTLRDVV